MNAVFHILFCFMSVFPPLTIEDIQEDISVYRHPDFNMQITGSANWNTLYHPSQSLAFEVINTNNNMQISMWYSKTNTNAESFLKAYANREGYIYSEGPNDTVLNAYTASYLSAATVINKSPSRLFIAAIEGDSGIYIFQVICPEDCYLSHREMMCNILASLRIGI